MVIFHCYVSSPEGIRVIFGITMDHSCWWFPVQLVARIHITGWIHTGRDPITLIAYLLAQVFLPITFPRDRTTLGFMPLETSRPAISLSMPSISTHLISIYCNSLLSKSEVEEEAEAGLKFWDKMKKVLNPWSKTDHQLYRSALFEKLKGNSKHQPEHISSENHHV